MADRSATEPATPRRLSRARRDGDHPISPALTALPGWIACAIFLPVAVTALLHQARELLALSFTANPETLIGTLPSRVASVVAPFIAVVAAGAAAVGLWQTGGSLSARPLFPKWSPGPSALVQRLRASTPLASAAILMVALGLFAWFAWTSLYARGPALAASIGNLEVTSALAAGLAQRLLWCAVAIGAAAAALEKVARHRAWLHRHRMTRDEVRRETREQQGDPALRQARQRSHEELLDGSHLARLPSTTLLVAASPRLVAALQYDPRHDGAPIVLFVAAGLGGQRIRGLAELSGIPVRDDAELAQQLARLPEGTAIPPSLYAAVGAALEAHVARPRS